MRQGGMTMMTVAGAATLLAVALPSSGRDLRRPFGETAVGNVSADTPIDLRADQLDYDRESGIITAVGQVVIVYGPDTLTAGQVEADVVSGRVEAIGEVTLRRGTDEIKADRLLYNFRTRVSSLDAPAIRADPFRVVAERVTRTSDAVFVLNDAKVTTCIYRHPHAHYHIRTRRLTVEPGERLRARGAVWYFGRVPCFYLPFWQQRLDEHSGWRLNPGYRSRWGAYLLGSYRYRPASWLRAEHQLDYRTDRGFAGGEELRWSSPGGFGDLSLYLLSDEDAEPSDRALEETGIPRDRYRIRLRHSQNIGERTRMMLNLQYLSDPLVVRDFFDREYRRARQPENVISLSHRWGGIALTVLANRRLNDFFDNVNRLPEARLDVFRRQLGDSSVYYESQTSGAWLERVWPEDDPRRPYDALRLDSNHMLYQPRRLAGWFNLVPRAGYRGTYYSKSLETRTVEGEDGPEIETVEAGEVFRSVFEIGSEFSFKAFRRLPGDPEHPWRHVVEPYADYAFRLEPDVLPGSLYPFDDTDRLDRLHALHLGIRNQLQTRSGGKGVTAADVNFFTTLQLDPDEGQPVLDGINLDSAFRPTDWLTLEMDGAYSVDEGVLQQFNTRLSLVRRAHWQASVEHRYRYRESSLLAMSATMSPSRAWSFNAFGRYEFEGSRLEEQGGYVQRTLDCLGIRLGGSMLPGYVRADGTERDDEYRVLLEIWLTAFPEMGIGARQR